MGETKVIINSANDLLLLGDSVSNVPLKEIARVSLKGLHRLESDIGLYEFLFTNVIHRFDLKEFESEVSLAVLPELVLFLDKIQEELQSNTLSCFFVENLTILLRLADVLLKLIEYLTARAEQFQLIRSIVIFPEYLLRCFTIVRRSYITMAHDTQVQETIKALFTVCTNLLTAFLHLTTPRNDPSGTYYFRSMSEDDEFVCLEKVCIVLASIGNEISGIYESLASDVWKVIVKLCIEQVESSFARNRTVWLGDIISILNTGIDASFSSIREKSESSKQCIIALKLNAFYLRVMAKLLVLSKHHTAIANFTSIINTLLKVKSFLRSKTISRELATNVEQFLHIGYMAIVESSIRSEIFAKALLQYESESEEEIHSFFHLVMHILAHMASNANDTTLPSLYCCRFNLLERINAILKCSDAVLLHNGTLYRNLLVHCSVLVLLGVRVKDPAGRKTVEETLVHMVLQDHYYTGLFGIDLWSVFVRYHSTRLMYAYFTFWKQINDQFSIFTTRPAQVYVAQLLRNMFVFLPAPLKAKIFNTYPVSDGANDRLWVTLAPSLWEIDESQRNQFMICLEKRMHRRMEAMGSVLGFYEIMGLILIAGGMTKLTPTLSAVIGKFSNSLQDWRTIMTTSTTSSIVECLARSRNQLLPLENVFNACNPSTLIETKLFVKYQILLAMGRVNDTTHMQVPFDVFLNDSAPFIKALGFHVLGKFKNLQNPAANQLFSQQPNLLSQLTLYENGSQLKLPTLSSALNGTHCVVHRCQQTVAEQDSSEPCGDLTLHINRKIDEMFPDDDDCFGESDTDKFTDALITKKRKFDIASDDDKVKNCLHELQVQASNLQQFSHSQMLQEPQKAQIRKIVSILTKVLDS
ncbi:uncharacterized protein LOC128724479 [Anopheles nili]|uniref:uncharacterized protein LOC128724479 n=1 Tax=Anopheles nili TaxID=185578 RepID=UPI00237A1B16|nr:uncharacterized protein LOC128724479 [Anopheles nili]